MGLVSTNNSGESSHAAHQGSDHKKEQHAVSVNEINTVPVEAVVSNGAEELQIDVHAIKVTNVYNVAPGQPQQLLAKINGTISLINHKSKAAVLKKPNVTQDCGATLVAAALARVSQDLRVTNGHNGGGGSTWDKQSAGVEKINTEVLHLLKNE
ncbi:uncharacterized protein LOC107807223 isoform X2 [Nicotiana tabacum]|uniref:Uncharacterized protein LOC107807223 isoform X2 n=1 Tax=Nicotiana tabacum TaxID=4097 RepID=A0AC58TZB9_TOBAC